MSLDNPYRAPDVSVEPPRPPLGPARLWRIPLWSSLIFIFAVLIHMVGYSLLQTWSPNPEDIRVGLKIGALMLDIAASAVAYVLYLVFLHGTGRCFLLQALGVFLLLQLMSHLLLVYVLRLSSSGLSAFDLAWNLGVCMLAYVTWHFGPGWLRGPSARQ